MNETEHTRQDRTQANEAPAKAAPVKTDSVGFDSVGFDSAKPDGKPDGARPDRAKQDRAKASSSNHAAKPEVMRTNNVRKLRTERMMSKAELARRAGLSTLTIDRVEKGMPCRMDTKRKILEALGLTPSDRVAVFGEEDG